MGKTGADNSGIWCECDDAPVYARGAATLLDHPDECGFPDRLCSVRNHRMTFHDRCGLPLQMRFCGCGATGFTFDLDRRWWVHYACGWPTRAWYASAAQTAPDHLVGLRPVTYHEFVAIPETPKASYSRLNERERDINRKRAGTWVRD